jgi:hypothetical protein
LACGGTLTKTFVIAEVQLQKSTALLDVTDEDVAKGYPHLLDMIMKSKHAQAFRTEGIARLRVSAKSQKGVERWVNNLMAKGKLKISSEYVKVQSITTRVHHNQEEKRNAGAAELQTLDPDFSRVAGGWEKDRAGNYLLTSPRARRNCQWQPVFGSGSTWLTVSLCACRHAVRVDEKEVPRGASDDVIDK